MIHKRSKNLQVADDTSAIPLPLLPKREGVATFLPKFKMRSPKMIKVVQNWTRKINDLSYFLSCECDKAFDFCTIPKKNANFERTEECKESFMNLKFFAFSCAGVLAVACVGVLAVECA